MEGGRSSRREYRVAAAGIQFFSRLYRGLCVSIRAGRLFHNRIVEGPEHGAIQIDGAFCCRLCSFVFGVDAFAMGAIHQTHDVHVVCLEGPRLLFSAYGIELLACRRAEMAAWNRHVSSLRQVFPCRIFRSFVVPSSIAGGRRNYQSRIFFLVRDGKPKFLDIYWCHGFAIVVFGCLGSWKRINRKRWDLTWCHEWWTLSVEIVEIVEIGVVEIGVGPLEMCNLL